LVAEALECHGGNGFVEESILPRLYREAPLNSIWEGSGNVICLDVLRAMGRSPDSVEAFFAEIAVSEGGNPRRATLVADLRKEVTNFEAIEIRARRIVERLALALQAALLVRHSDPAVADAFCAARLTDNHGLAFGTLPAGVAFANIIERARPQVG